MHYCKWTFHVARIRRLVITLSVLFTANPAIGVVASFTSKPAWQAAAGAHTTIDFTGFDVGTIITTQYQSLGVIFTEGNDRINALQSFVNDGFGLNGVIDTFTLAFSQPMRTIACEFPGSLQFKLYSQGQLIHTSTIFGNVGTGFFGGLISDQPFDSAIVIDPQGDVYVDDLHFGQGIPGPCTMVVLGMGICIKRRKRCADINAVN